MRRFYPAFRLSLFGQGSGGWIINLRRRQCRESRKDASVEDAGAYSGLGRIPAKNSQPQNAQHFVQLLIR